MKIEVLLSTMDYIGVSQLEKMNLCTDIIIGNQTDYERVELSEYNGCKVLVVSTTQKGLSYNRNQTLMRASGDIALIADDDVIYNKDYAKIVENEFNSIPNADIIVFNIRDNAPEMERYVNRKRSKVYFLNYMRYGSVRIAFRTEKIKREGIFFNTMFGAGQDIKFGEDTIFLHDCLKKGLKVYASEKYISSLCVNRGSTWFEGYNESYYRSKAMVFRQINRRFARLLCLQDAVRHFRMYKEQNPFLCYAKMEKYL